MSLPIWLLVVLGAAAACLALAALVLGLRLRRLRKVMRQLRASLPEEQREFVSEQAMQIGVVVLNPIELAEQRSALFAGIGSLAPGLIRSRVYAVVAKQLSQELEARGVEAWVEVQRLGK